MTGIEVRKELNLIQAVRKLSSLGLKMLPVKIRLEQNRMNLIKKTLNDRPEYVNINALAY